MSLPPDYENELNTLNREILKAQPPDVLQFCANFFQKRLESQRAEFLLAMSSGASGSSASAFGGFGGLSAGRASPSYVGGETSFPGFGSSIGSPGAEIGPDTRIEEEDLEAHQSPTSATFTGSPFKSSPKQPSLAEQVSKPGAAVREPRGKSKESQTPNTLGPGGFGSSFRSPSPNRDFPSNYNMNRRTSVSAESLAPSSGSHDEWTPPMHPKSAEQLSRLRSAIANNFLFLHLDEEQTSQVLGALLEKPIPHKDTRIITQGDQGDFFYVVEKGNFAVYVNKAGSMQPGKEGMGKWVADVGPGGSFGELALMYNAPRAATIISTEPNSILWSLDRVTFRRILMEGTSKRRRMYEAFLETVPILSSLLPYERAKIADALDTVTYPADTTIIKEGDPGEAFFMIESGMCEVRKRDDGGKPINILKKGDYFGELALINDAPRAASVITKDKVKVATLNKDGFTRLLGPVVDIMRRNDPRMHTSDGLDEEDSKMEGIVGGENYTMG